MIFNVSQRPSDPHLNENVPNKRVRVLHVRRNGGVPFKLREGVAAAVDKPVRNQIECLFCLKPNIFCTVLYVYVIFFQIAYLFCLIIFLKHV